MGTQKTIEINMDVRPIPKERPRHDARGFFYTPAKTRQYEKEVKNLASRIYKGKALECPLSVEIEFLIERGKTVKRALPSVKPDLDNLVKAVKDALNGVVWKDDSLICKLVASKKYGGPGIKIKVEYE